MGEKIDWLDQNLGIVRTPGHFPLTGGGHGAGFAAGSVPNLPSSLVWMMGDQKCHLPPIY